MFNKSIKRLKWMNSGHFHSPVEHSVEKQENADFAFDKQKGFNGLHYRSHVRWNLEIALKSGIDNNVATV
jgi:hypothetical protein